MKSTFQTQVRIGFEHCDPEGILFFGNIYGLAHDAYERLIEHLGFSYKDWFQNSEWGVPLRKSECLYSAPLTPGRYYDIAVTVPQISESSFTSHYVFSHAGRTHAEVTLVHVFFDRQTRAKRAIPSEVRRRLESYQRESGATE